MRACKVRLIITDEEGRLFGKGPYELLQATLEYESVRQATRALGLSYSKAWQIIRRLESGYGQPLIRRHSGGKDGGGAGLTDFALQLMAQYRQLQASVDAFASEEYLRVFGE